RLAAQLASLLAAAAAAPETPLAALPLLAAAERHQVTVEWNDTLWDAGADAAELVHGPFASQARRDPGAVAVEVADPEAAGGGAALTYGELAARARSVAAALAAAGVGPEAVVALCAEPSAALLAGLLGILQAGGAYLPLDPSHPPERLAQVLA